MLIYLSCPSTDKDQITKIARNLMREGHFVVLPSRYRSLLAEWCSDSDYELLKRCDAIFLSHGWQNSNGCQRELRHATNLTKQIFIENYVEPC